MSAVQPLQRPQTVYLADYRPPEFRIDSVDLHFNLHEVGARVRARLFVERAADTPASRPLVLHGEGLELVSVALDGRTLSADEYRVDEETLTVPGVPARFALEIENRIDPAENTALEGLYVSGGNFCTQCEAEGFRRITYFLDRPDVMARYTTTVVADRARCPVLLSNGNPVDRGELGDGRHWVRWEDPFPKPSYLFALVAGDLACVEDEFVTVSGRRVLLQVYVQRHNLDKCAHAMDSLKRAMRWDEEVYGREYDLDRFMIVAVDDFNMGAMENKGLNIFNSACVLASPQTATDADYESILGIVGHEYFHNWSGNRVTCRDWFQLSLKEGFTVFRDQEFSADLTSRGVKRIGDVNALRNAQFREDAGPMAHPVRPESYEEISNFYTATVYLKGAEVVRMIRNLLGPEGFRKGTDLYFERHDGQAVTTDDFVRAMEDATGADLGQFRLWYSQAGTPLLHVERRYDAAAGTLTLTVRQSCPPTPGQPEKAPFHIPLAVGLLDRDGRELAPRLQGESAVPAGTRVLELRGASETFVFTGLAREPVVSLLRGFSAPVRLEMPREDEELAFLMAHDTDPFSRWDAGQQLAVNVLLRLIDARRGGRALEADAVLAEAFRRSLSAGERDHAFLARLLTLPTEGYVAEFLERIDPAAVHAAHGFLRRSLGRALRSEWTRVYAELGDSGAYRSDAEAVGRRSLRNLALAYRMEDGEEAAVRACLEQFRTGDNMTDTLAALAALARSERPEREAALEEFYARWKDDPLVVDKWFAIQAGAPLPDALERVRALTRHPAFNARNPNKVRAVIGTFCRSNPGFHAPDGAGYAFLADWVLELDAKNPQIAARLAGALSRWRRYEPDLGRHMRAQIERILAAARLSPDVREVASKSLA